MRKFVFFLALFALMGGFGLAFADTPGVLNAAGDFIPTKVGAAAPSSPVGELATPVGLFITLLVQLLKSSAFAGYLKTVDRRLRILVPVGISAALAVVGAFKGMYGWEEAFRVAWDMAAASVLGGEALSHAMNLRTGEAPAKDAPVQTGPTT